MQYILLTLGILVQQANTPLVSRNPSIDACAGLDRGAQGGYPLGEGTGRVGQVEEAWSKVWAALAKGSPVAICILHQVKSDERQFLGVWPWEERRAVKVTLRRASGGFYWMEGVVIRESKAPLGGWHPWAVVPVEFHRLVNTRELGATLARLPHEFLGSPRRGELRVGIRELPQ